MVAGSFIGAEYTSGSLGQLAHLPAPRDRVLVTKLVAVVALQRAGRRRWPP